MYLCLVEGTWHIPKHSGSAPCGLTPPYQKVATCLRYLTHMRRRIYLKQAALSRGGCCVYVSPPVYHGWLGKEESWNVPPLLSLTFLFFQMSYCQAVFTVFNLCREDIINRDFTVFIIVSVAFNKIYRVSKSPWKHWRKDNRINKTQWFTAMQDAATQCNRTHTHNVK